MDLFSGMDDEPEGTCPVCRRREGSLVYTSFSKKPVSCSICVWEKQVEKELNLKSERERIDEAVIASVKERKK